MDAVGVPGPLPRVVVEGQQVLLHQRLQELDHEERVAGGLVLHQLCQRRDARPFAMERLGKQLLDVGAAQRRQLDVIDLDPGVADGQQLAGQRMGGIDLVVPVGAHQHQVAQVGTDQHILDQVERGGVQPLEVIEEQRQRVLRLGKHADKAPEHQQKALLGLLRLQVRHRFRLADDQLQLGNQVRHQPGVGLQRLQQRTAPARQLRVGLAEQRAHQALERLHQCRVRDIALVLVELAGGEQPARRHQHPVQLVDHRGLADARVAGHQHQFRRAGADDAGEGREHGVDLLLAPVQLLGDHQAVARAVLVERKVLDAALALPVFQAAPQVVLDPGGGLVALLGGLGQQFHDDARQRGRHGLHPHAGRRRHPGDMAVHPFHGVRRREG
ncbi:hypothetical protein D3C72_1321980 [compost metagenome]